MPRKIDLSTVSPERAQQLLRQRERKKQAYAQRPAEFCARSAAWKAENPERVRATKQAWAAANRERRNALARARYQSRRAAESKNHG